MQQQELLAYLIEYLLREAHGEATLNLPEDEATRWEMYRVLTNVRAPQPIADTYLDV